MDHGRSIHLSAEKYIMGVAFACIPQPFSGAATIICICQTGLIAVGLRRPYSGVHDDPNPEGIPLTAGPYEFTKFLLRSS